MFATIIFKACFISSVKFYFCYFFPLVTRLEAWSNIKECCDVFSFNLCHISVRHVAEKKNLMWYFSVLISHTHLFEHSQEHFSYHKLLMCLRHTNTIYGYRHLRTDTKEKFMKTHNINTCTNCINLHQD